MVYEIRIKGQVQGVGFRPFVYCLATEMQLSGYVNNTNEGVLIEIVASEKIKDFTESLLSKAPKLAKITELSTKQINRLPKYSEGFHIIKSQSGDKRNVLLSPDFGICEQCSNEIDNQKNHRFQYAFTTCTYCGPRYSIIKQLPYDREHTSMGVFEMCDDCRQEYQNVNDRRYFSQTNSCKKCGIKLTLFDNQKRQIADNDSAVIEQTIKAISEGKIVAVKGIGGYLLMCDATQPSTIETLRLRKHRPLKPFAVMYPSLVALEKQIEVRAEEREILTNEVAVIVLLSTNIQLSTAGLVGVMLPYTPLFQLICQKIDRPLIATSGNLSHSPIIYQDAKALDELSEIADFILVNNREIVVPQDDSVLRFTPKYNKKIVLRRSRGLAPTFILPSFFAQNNIIAMGAMLKSTFTITHENNVYVSQYLGDLEDFDSQENYKNTLSHLSNVLSFTPQTVLVDMHKAYSSTEMGRTIANEKQLKLAEIQHHKAHFAAVLAENNLLDSSEPILGVIWDGTGLGEDGQIWGGEFFSFRSNSIERVGHFEYFPNLMGDKMAREPRLSALAVCSSFFENLDFLKEKFSDLEWNIYQKHLKQAKMLQNSSVGRLFDAMASLLGIADKVSYEGEAAINIESIAQAYLNENGIPNEIYEIVILPQNTLSIQHLLQGVSNDLNQNVNIGKIALKFHLTMIESVNMIANKLNISKIAFSGGVWQNALLVDLVIERLSNFELYFHQQLSPNDECISFGQVAFFELINRNKS
ncbi:carbamoyltransferase [Emticicia aquatilis]|uniref:Carbamoyltransferase n=1 Tax=Emticicia aquatilis TaxID=1537369 RepID=A0A916Z1V0_9BACT|nr:carbamoyltransferase HypF [Emticicia aquatilis]GGD70598.1 carbamoyltransferase [Emticicia aquatilis]